MEQTKDTKKLNEGNTKKYRGRQREKETDRDRDRPGREGRVCAYVCLRLLG